MTKLSKFHVVAVEGATVDGRTIERSWIKDMADTFNPATYGVRLNMEHIRGVTADGPFKAYGDVRAVKAEEREFDIAGKKAKKLCLLAQVEPTEELVSYNQKRQKIYTSVEINTDFAKSGKAALVGLAVTDSPASLGTDVLQFAATQGEKSFLRERKQDPGNYFSEALEGPVFEFEDAPATASTGEYSGFFKEAREFFKGFAAPREEQQPAKPEPAAPANDNAAQFAQLMQGMKAMSDGMDAMSKKVSEDIAGLNTKFAGLEKTIESTDGDPKTRRAPQHDGGKFALADC